MLPVKVEERKKEEGRVVEYEWWSMSGVDVLRKENRG